MNKETISLVYSNLEKNSKDKVVNNHDNIIRIFENDENLLNLFRLNEFTQMKEINKKPFWRNQNDIERLWTDIDESQLLIYLEIGRASCRERVIMWVVEGAVRNKGEKVKSKGSER